MCSSVFSSQMLIVLMLLRTAYFVEFHKDNSFSIRLMINFYDRHVVSVKVFFCTSDQLKCSFALVMFV